MTDALANPSLHQRLRDSWRVLFKELTSFGIVGGLGLIVDLGLFHVLIKGHVSFWFLSIYGTSKIISTTVATVVTYIGNRYFSFSHRARTGLRREAGFFFIINLLILLISLVILYIFSHPFGFNHQHPHGDAVIQIVNFGTIALGTIIRFWAYKRFVFLHPDKVHLLGASDVDLDTELADD